MHRPTYKELGFSEQEANEIRNSSREFFCVYTNCRKHKPAKEMIGIGPMDWYCSEEHYKKDLEEYPEEDD